MSDPSANAEASLEEQLVAYLDGELDAEASRRVEELLAADGNVRQTLQSLDRTWELLDELATAQVADRFTQSTLEMVTAAAVEDTERARTEASGGRRRRCTILGGTLIAAGLAGFLAVWNLMPDPNRQLVDDLPVLEHLDQYRQIENVEFLRMLRDQGLFVREEEEPGDGQ